MVFMGLITLMAFATFVGCEEKSNNLAESSSSDEDNPDVGDATVDSIYVRVF